MAEFLSVETALPDYCVTAEETKAYLSARLPAEAARRFSRLLDASGNRTRHSVLPLDELLRLQTLDARNERYTRHAVELGEVVARKALTAADVAPDSVTTFVCVSATGYMMPSLETHLINRLGLSRTCRRIPMMQLGCAGGVASVGLATELLSARSGGTALIVSVELPSLSLQTAEPAATDIMSSIQFGDGAAAAVLSSPWRGRGPEVLATQSALFPDTADEDGIRLTQTGLRVRSQQALPRLIASHLPGMVERFLDTQDARLGDVSFWIVHPRAPQILAAVSASLRLEAPALAPSWSVWHGCGNMVSASAFFVLRRLHQANPPPDGALGIMLAIGAGVSCEMALLRSAGWLSAPN